MMFGDTRKICKNNLSAPSLKDLGLFWVNICENQKKYHIILVILHSEPLLFGLVLALIVNIIICSPHVVCSLNAKYARLHYWRSNT